jgi:hypothetical protein
MRALKWTYRLHTIKTKSESTKVKTILQRQIETKDKQIDSLVYELYGLTVDDIKIVGGGRGRSDLWSRTFSRINALLRKQYKGGKYAEIDSIVYGEPA